MTTRFTVAAAVNDDAVLHSSLLASPEINLAGEVLLMRRHPSAADAYNRALDTAANDLILFAHQDLYLPPGWLDQLRRALGWLEAEDPEWGVLGLLGVANDRSYHGWLHSTGLGMTLGASFDHPCEVRTLDEVLLILRRSTGLRYDERLRGFHMYGTDICLTAEANSRRNYAIPAFAIHNSNGIRNLPWAFWRSCLHIHRKWRRALPVYSPCVQLEQIPLRAVGTMLSRLVAYTVLRRSVSRRVSDPATLYFALSQKPPAAS